MSFLSQAQIARLSRKAYGKLLADTRQIGLHPQTHDPFLVSQLYRTMGMYVLGNQGLGKTRLLQSLIHQDIFSDVSTVERIMHIFTVLWPEVTSQAFLPT